MKHIFLTTTLIFIIPSIIKATPIDSTFQNRIEKEALINYSNGNKVEPIELFVSFNESDLNKIENSQKEVLKLIEEIEKKEIGKKKLKQKIQIIYKLTHDQYFKQYETNTFFDKIFENGNYNCVTATSLYALILNHFSINYKIKKTPNHVYLEVKDLRKNILMESTFPQDGVFEYSDNFKKYYVDYLEKNKLLRNEDKELSMQQIFSQYFYSAEIINIYQLASLQYYNMGLQKLNSANFNDALNNFEKCKIIDNNNSSIDYLINLSLLAILDNGSTDAHIFLKFVNKSNNSLINQETIEYYFDNISKKIINNNITLDKYDNFFAQLTNSISDTTILNIIRFKYYIYSGHYYEANGQIKNAINVIGKAYSLKPTNLEVKNTLLALLDKNLQSIGYRGQDITTTIEDYYNTYPFLKDYNDFNNFRVAVYACGVMDNLYRKDIDSALKYLPGFENSVKGIYQNQDIMMTIGEVYGDFYRLYLKKGNTKKARYYMNQGYELSPNNIVLKNYEQNLIKH
jgi:hypothetical protein